jgi:NADPH:quinone reductase-like Zn-dependent oxidoreductase
VRPIPLIIYGASTAVGSYAIKMASNTNIHPIIAIVGRESQYVKGLLDKGKGDTVVESTVKGIRSSLEGTGHSVAHHAIDAVIFPESAEVLKQSVTPGGQIDFILLNDMDVSPGIKLITSVRPVHNQPEFKNNGN